jgi:ubiquinone/menaquinone biosynthesis C-methylase UbiE
MLLKEINYAVDKKYKIIHAVKMLKQCHKHFSNLNIELIQGNAQHLPFADASFDVLFYFGGINLFNEPKQALCELVRVVKEGGIVAWGDEQMSDDFRHPLGRFLLSHLNPGFLKTPPAIPQGISDLKKYKVYGGLGYLNVTCKISE